MKLKIEDINDYSPGEYMLFEMDADPERLEKAARFKNEKDYKLCLLTDNLAKRMIAEEGNMSPQMVVIYADKYGKPRCMNSLVKFNYSHSGTKAACAVSDKEIGVDIEEIKPRSQDVARKFATEAELEYIGDSLENLLKIWVLKEAYLKCLGTGIRDNLKDAEFIIEDSGNVICSDKSVKATLYDNTPGYIAAVCEKIS